MRTPVGRTKYLSGEQLHKILDAADTLAGPAGLGIRLGTITGARRGEIVALRWSDVDLEGGVVAITKSMTEIGKVRDLKSTKTRATRQVVVDEPTRLLLLARRDEMVRLAAEAMVPFDADSFVLADGPFSSMPIRGDFMYRRFKEIAAAVDAPTARFHDLRHGHATELLGQGLDLASVSERLGHGAKTTTARYLHGDIERQRSAIKDFTARLIETEAATATA